MHSIKTSDGRTRPSVARRCQYRSYCPIPWQNDLHIRYLWELGSKSEIVQGKKRLRRAQLTTSYLPFWLRCYLICIILHSQLKIKFNSGRSWVSVWHAEQRKSQATNGRLHLSWQGCGDSEIIWGKESPGLLCMQAMVEVDLTNFIYA